MRLMPWSRAARMVAMDWASSVPPHIHPPMAHVPMATRDTVSDVPAMAACSIGASRWVSRVSAWRFMIRLRFLKRTEPLRAATDAMSVAFLLGGERRVIDQDAGRLGVAVI